MKGKIVSSILIIGMLFSLSMQHSFFVQAGEICKRNSDNTVKLARTQEKPLNILQIGDSNTMIGYLTLNMRDLLIQKGYDTGTGFFALNPDEYFLKKKLENLSFSYSGSWQRFDMAEKGKHCMIDNAPNGAYIKGNGNGSSCIIRFIGSALDLYYCSQVGAGAFQVNIDGQDIENVETDKYGDNQIHKVSFKNLGYKSHTIKFTIKDDRPVLINGADAMGQSSENRTTIHSWGNSSASTKDYAHLDKKNFESGLKAVNPNEVVVFLGTNDVGSPAPDNDPKAVENNLVTVLSRIKEALPDADIWLLSTLETSGNNDTLHEYWNTSLPNAAKKVGVNYWSMGEFYGKFEPDKMLLDGVHVNDKGGKLLMEQLYRRMILKREIDEAKNVENQLKGYGEKVIQVLTKGISEAEKVHLNHRATKEEVEGQTKALKDEIKTAIQDAQDIEDHEEAPRANILDIAFRDGTAYDRTLFKHKLHVIGNPVIKKDEELGKYVAEFDGVNDAYSYQMSNIDYEIFKQGYTLDCMIKLKDQEQNGAIFSNLENGAVGLMTEKSIIKFSEKRNGWDSLTHGISQDQWIHLVVTSDSKAIKLYINGKLKNSIDCSKDGSPEFPDCIEKFFTLGGDSENGQKVISPSKVIVSSAGIFSRALTSEEVKCLYWQEEKTDIVLPKSAEFEAVEGDEYKVPEATVRTATGEKAEIKVCVKDFQGNKINLTEGQFTVKAGDYKILYEANGKSIEKVLKVSEKKEQIPQVDQEKTMEEGEQGQIVINNIGEDSELSFISENPQIVSVNQKGLIRANRKGQTIIKILVKQAGYIYNLSSKISVEAKPTVISQKEMIEGDQYGIIVQNRLTNAHIVFSSMNSAVASVNSNGLVRANKIGETEIRTTVEQTGKVHTLTTKIVVRGKPIVVIKPFVNIASRTLLANNTCKITVNHSVTGAKINFKSCNRRIASVSKYGNVKGLKKGKTTIITTVKQCGKIFTLKTNITVHGYVKFIKLKKIIKRKKSYVFKAKAFGMGSNLKWFVSNKKLAKISSKGKFMAKKKKGKVYVIVKSGQYTKRILVKIK